jgi:hypothetical protein
VCDFGEARAQIKLALWYGQNKQEWSASIIISPALKPEAGSVILLASDASLINSEYQKCFLISEISGLINSMATIRNGFPMVK